MSETYEASELCQESW